MGAAEHAHEAVVARRPLEREGVSLDGGRRTTQLMRDSLGGPTRMRYTHSMNSFPVRLGSFELGQATLSLPPSGSEARGLFEPSPGMSGWHQLIDRALGAAPNALRPGIIVVDPVTGMRVATVLTLYGPVAGGRGTWRIAVRFDTAPTLP